MDYARAYRRIREAVDYADSLRGPYFHLLINVVPEVRHIRVSGEVIGTTANWHSQLSWHTFEEGKTNLLIAEIDRIADALKPHCAETQANR